MEREYFLDQMGMEYNLEYGSFKVTNTEKGIRLVAVLGVSIWGGSEVTLSGTAWRGLKNGFKYWDWLTQETGTYNIKRITTTIDFGRLRGGESDVTTEETINPSGEVVVDTFRNDPWLVQ